MGTASSNCSALTAIFNWKDTPPPKYILCKFQDDFYLNCSNIMNHTLMLLSFLLCCCSTPGSKVVKQVRSLSFKGELFVKHIKYPIWDLTWHTLSAYRYEDIFSECMAVLFIISSLDCVMCSFGRPQGLISIHCHPLVYKVRRAFCLLPYLRNCSVCLQTLFVSFFKCTRVVFFILFVSQETCLNLLKKQQLICFGKRLIKSSVDHVDFSPFHIAKSK